MQTCRIVAALIGEFQAKTGWSDVLLAKNAGKDRDTIGVIRNWNGANSAPNLNSTLAFETVIRNNFVPGDTDASEALYQSTIKRLRKELA
jgi:hypothetical protein